MYRTTINLDMLLTISYSESAYPNKYNLYKFMYIDYKIFSTPDDVLITDTF